MDSLEKEREAFKYWFKREKIARTGTWCADDEKELEKKMQEIEHRASTLALLLTGVELALAVGAVMFGLHLIGLI